MFVTLRSDLQSRSIFQFSLNIATIKCYKNAHCAVETVFFPYTQLECK